MDLRHLGRLVHGRGWPAHALLRPRTVTASTVSLWFRHAAYGIRFQTLDSNGTSRTWRKYQDSDPYTYAGTQEQRQAVLGTEGVKLLKQLEAPRSDPVIALRERLDAGELTVDTLHVCLKEYSNRLRRSPRRKRLGLIRSSRVGTLALHWLWADDVRWSLAVRDDPEMLKLL